MAGQATARALRLLRLGLPIAAGRLGVVGMGLTDTIVVGQLAPSELGFQALGWMLNGPALIGGLGLLLGVQILAARLIGAGEGASAGTVWRRGLVVALVAGAGVCCLVWLAGPMLVRLFGVDPALAAGAVRVMVVLTLAVPFHLAFMASAKFLEALQRPSVAAVAMWLGNGLNLVLNLLFVPQHGAVGSAWATVISRVTLAAGLAAFVLWAPSLRRYHGGAKPRDGYGPLLAIGIAAAVSGLAEAGAFSAMGVIAARAGGSVSVAVWTIATGGFLTLVYLLAQGLSTAGLVLVSEAAGAGDARQARSTGWLTIGLTSAVMAACGLACLVFAGPFVAGFTTDPQVRAGLVAMMALTAILMVPDGGQGAADAILRARGENVAPTAIRLVAFLLIAPPLAFALVEGMHSGISGVFIGILAASSLAFAALLLRLALRDRTPPSAAEWDFAG